MHMAAPDAAAECSHVPPCFLRSGSTLGWTTWVLTRQSAEEPGLLCASSNGWAGPERGPRQCVGCAATSRLTHLFPIFFVFVPDTHTARTLPSSTLHVFLRFLATSSHHRPGTATAFGHCALYRRCGHCHGARSVAACTRLLGSLWHLPARAPHSACVLLVFAPGPNASLIPS